MKDENESVGSVIDSCFRPNKFAQILPYADALDKIRQLYKKRGQSNLILIESRGSGFAAEYVASYDVNDSVITGTGKTPEDAVIDLVSSTASELVQILYLLESNVDSVIIDGWEAKRGDEQ